MLSCNTQPLRRTSFFFVLRRLWLTVGSKFRELQLGGLNKKGDPNETNKKAQKAGNTPLRLR